jgi:hypothetical protein
MPDKLVSNSKVSESENDSKLLSSFLTTYEEKVSEARSQLKQVENLLGSLPNVKQDNSWLKVAGMHKDNPLFEEVAASIEAHHQDITEEELN